MLLAPPVWDPARPTHLNFKSAPASGNFSFSIVPPEQRGAAAAVGEVSGAVSEQRWPATAARRRWTAPVITTPPLEAALKAFTQCA